MILRISDDARTRKGILRLRGELPEAEQEATRAAEELRGFLRRAQRIWTEIELPLELARTRVLLARTCSLLGEAK